MDYVQPRTVVISGSQLRHLAGGPKISGRDQRKIPGNLGGYHVRPNGLLYNVVVYLNGKLVYRVVVPEDFQEGAMRLPVIDISLRW